MPPRISRKITCLQFLCAVMIVGLHTAFAAYFKTAAPWAAQVNSWARHVFDAAISTFITLSAMLTFAKPRSYGGLLKRRFASIVIPYVLWGLVYLAYDQAMGYLTWGAFPSITLGYALEYIALHSASGIFWFLRVLLAFALLYPAVEWCVRRKWPAAALFAASLAYALSGRVDYHSFLYWLPHYLLGAWAGMYGLWQRSAKRRITPVLALLALAALRPSDGPWHYLYWLPAPVLLWLAADGLPVSEKPLPWWMGASFYLYCSHLLVERYAVKLYLAVMGTGTVASVLGNVVLPVLCTAMALLCGAAARRICPAAFGLFTGQRNIS